MKHWVHHLPGIAAAAKAEGDAITDADLRIEQVSALLAALQRQRNAMEMDIIHSLNSFYSRVEISEAMAKQIYLMGG